MEENKLSSPWHETVSEGREPSAICPGRDFLR